MSVKAIGFFTKMQDHNLRNGESPVIRIPVYATRVRSGHTEAKVFDGRELVWVALPIDADPQHTKDPTLVLNQAS